MLSQISTSDFDMWPYCLVILLFLGFSPTLLGYTRSTLPASSFGLILKLFCLLWFSPGCLSCVFQKVVPKLKFLVFPLATEGGKDPGLFTESAVYQTHSHCCTWVHARGAGHYMEIKGGSPVSASSQFLGIFSFLLASFIIM